MPSMIQKTGGRASLKPSRNGRRKTKTAGPHPIDLHVGNRLRELRILNGLGQVEIAKILGITFQQFQKYERGANRISASRLFDIAEAFRVPVSYFFDMLPTDLAEKSISERSETITRPIVSREDPMQRRETLDLVRNFYGIKDDLLRARLFDLIKSVSNYPDCKEN